MLQPFLKPGPNFHPEPNLPFFLDIPLITNVTNCLTLQLVLYLSLETSFFMKMIFLSKKNFLVWNQLLFPLIFSLTECCQCILNHLKVCLNIHLLLLLIIQIILLLFLLDTQLDNTNFLHIFRTFSVILFIMIIILLHMLCIVCCLMIGYPLLIEL